MKYIHMFCHLYRQEPRAQREAPAFLEEARSIVMTYSL